MRVAISRVALVSIVAIALAACGGGGSHHDLVPATTSGTARDVQSTTTIPATVYVSGKGSVYSYPLTATGTTAPSAVIGSEYNADGTAISGIATDRKGTLYVLTSYAGTEGPNGPSCYVKSAPLGGTALGVVYQCGSGVFYGVGLATAPNGEVDVLDTADNTGLTHWQVERFGPTTGMYSSGRFITLSGAAGRSIAAGAQGNLFVGTFETDGDWWVSKYAAGVTGSPGTTAQTGSTIVGGAMGPVSAGRGAVFAAMADPSGIWSITRFNATLTTLQLTLGPFAAGETVSALANDASGNLWVGITTAAGTELREYASDQVNPAQTTQVLANPVRRGNPAGAVITGIAIAQ